MSIPLLPRSFATFFEDDGDTSYFYAVERGENGIKILDALQVYVVAVEPAEPRQLQIVWSRDGLKSALFVNGLPRLFLISLRSVVIAAEVLRCRVVIGQMRDTSGATLLWNFLSEFH